MISLISCDNRIKAKFEIINQTDYILDSINIKSFRHKANSNYLKLEPGESQIYWLDMTDLPKGDGEYLLTLKGNSGSIKRKQFGYYTNGYPLEEVTIIKIRKDTIIINQIFDNY